jgi:hypothetical protein
LPREVRTGSGFIAFPVLEYIQWVDRGAFWRYKFNLAFLHWYSACK